MNNLVMSWHTEDGRLVCRWNESEDNSSELTVQADGLPMQRPDYWNADVVFELGDAA